MIRTAVGYTWADLARIAEVSPRMVGKYESREKGINHAQVDVVGRLAVVLHVDASDLYERVLPGNRLRRLYLGRLNCVVARLTALGEI